MAARDSWAIIPAYNEGGRISSVVEKIKRYVKNIVVVDDGSSDDTKEEGRKAGAVVLSHIVNLGKGAAAKTGCDYALRKGAEVMILVDADGQHDPAEIPNFLKALEEADIVFGYRRLNKNMPLVFRLGNSFINYVMFLAYGLRLRDTQCGYRAFSADAYRKIRWKARDYSMESEMIANVGRKKLRYREVPIKTIYGDKYKGTTVLDGIKIVFRIITWRLFK